MVNKVHARRRRKMPGTRRYLGVEGWMRARETTLSAPLSYPLTFHLLLRLMRW